MFKANFASYDLKFYEEKVSINLEFLICLVKSWSAYYNFINKKSASEEDPLEIFKNEFLDALRKICGSCSGRSNEELMKVQFDYYNFYFVICLNN